MSEDIDMQIEYHLRELDRITQSDFLRAGSDEYPHFNRFYYKQGWGGSNINIDKACRFNQKKMELLSLYGYDTFWDISNATDSELLSIKGIGIKTVKKLRFYIQFILKADRVRAYYRSDLLLKDELIKYWEEVEGKINNNE